MSRFPSTRIDADTALAAWRDGAILIDVRSDKGRGAHGEIRGAVVVPKPDVVEFVTRRLEGRRQPVVLFCGSVAGTEKLVAGLLAEGVEDVAEVDGGYAALTATGAFAPAAAG